MTHRVRTTARHVEHHLRGARGEVLTRVSELRRRFPEDSWGTYLAWCSPMRAGLVAACVMRRRFKRQ